MPISFVRNKIDEYRQHYFVRNFATLQIGNVIGNILQAGAGVVIARLLQPERFGVYTLAFSLASLFSVFLGTGAQDAATTVVGGAYAREDKQEVHNVLAFLLKIVFLAGVITLIAASFGPLIAGHFYHNSRIGYYAIIVVAASIISTSFWSLTSMSLQIVGRIKSLMLLDLSDQIFRYGLSLPLVALGSGVLGAALGHFFGALAVFVISVMIWEGVRRRFTIFPSIRRLARQAIRAPIKKYLGFSLTIAIDRNIGTLYMALPVLLTGLYVTTSEVTYFKLAFGFVNLCLTFLAPISTLLNVEFPRMKELEPKRLKHNFIRVSIYSMIISTAITIAAIIIAPIVFRVLYGASFLPSLTYVPELIVYGALFGIGVGLGSMWRAINKVKVSIMISAAVLALGIPLGIILIRNYGLWGSIIMVTVWFTVSHFVSFFYLLKSIPKRVF